MSGRRLDRTRLRQLQRAVLPRLERIDGLDDEIHYSLKPRPVRGRKDKNGDLELRQVLLVVEVAVGGNQRIELRFGPAQKLTVGKPGPSELVGCLNDVIGKMIPEWDRNALVEEDPQAPRRSGCLSAASGVLEHRVDLLPRDARKPPQELLDGRAAFQVLEQRADRNAGAAKQPGPAHLGGISLDSRAGAPVKHGSILLAARRMLRGKDPLPGRFRPKWGLSLIRDGAIKVLCKKALERPAGAGV